MLPLVLENAYLRVALCAVQIRALAEGGRATTWVHVESADNIRIFCYQSMTITFVRKMNPKEMALARQRLYAHRSQSENYDGQMWRVQTLYAYPLP